MKPAKRRGTVSELMHSGSLKCKKFNKEGRKSFSEWTQKSKEASRLSLKLKYGKRKSKEQVVSRTRHMSYGSSPSHTTYHESRESLSVSGTELRVPGHGNGIDGASSDNCISITVSEYPEVLNYGHESDSDPNRQSDSRTNVLTSSEHESDVSQVLPGRLPRVLYPQYRQKQVTPVTPLVTNFYERDNEPVRRGVPAVAPVTTSQSSSLQQQRQYQQHMNHLMFRNCGHDSPSQSQLNLGNQGRCGKVCSHCFEQLQHLSPRQLTFQERKKFFESMS